jgi:hypothetical protein
VTSGNIYDVWLRLLSVKVFRCSHGCQWSDLLSMPASVGNMRAPNLSRYDGIACYYDTWACLLATILLLVDILLLTDEIVFCSSRGGSGEEGKGSEAETHMVTGRWLA